MTGEGSRDQPAPNDSDADIPSDAWYDHWFGEEYLDLYPHRNEDEARSGVGLVLRQVQLSQGAPVLDLACGAGRHLRPLSRHGYHAVGLDLSLPLLMRAREEGLSTPLVRGDMRRLPFRNGAFSLVTSFFTSFGYFEDANDDQRVLAEVRRVLRPASPFLLDFLNAHRVRRKLTPHDRKVFGEREVVQERRIVDGGEIVEKTIRILDGSGGEARVFRERVRLYLPADLESLLVAEGFSLLHTFGDYEGNPFGDTSPRMIILAQSP